MKSPLLDDNFYLFSKATKRGSAWVGTSDAYPGYRVIKCATCGTQGLEWFPPGTIKPVEIMITRPGDLDDIQREMGVMIVSDRFRRAVLKGKLTGLVFRKPKAVLMAKDGPRWRTTKQDAEEKTKFWIVYVVGDGGSIAKQAGLRVKKRCSVCGNVEWTAPVRKIRIDRSQWDGSDFFRVREYGPVLMTPHAAEILGQAGLTNFGTKKLSQSGWGR